MNHVIVATVVAVATLFCIGISAVIGIAIVNFPVLAVPVAASILVGVVAGVIDWYTENRQ